jgi:hypothetical protein
VRGFTGSQVFNNFGATTELGEPLHCGGLGGASVWFPVLADVTGPLRVTTDGSDFDTVLAVYSGPGTDFATLREITCDDNSGQDGRDSSLVFNATAGTTYYVAVDGVGGVTGTAVLNVTPGNQPVIVEGPQSRAVGLGQDLELTVTLAGTGPFGYQWFHNGQVVPGATNASFRLLGFGPDVAGTYHVRVTTPFGSANSPVAQLLANSPPRVDNIRLLSTLGLTMRLICEANTTCVTDVSTDLVSWRPIFTNSSPAGLIDVTDSAATNARQRFYRFRGL